MSNAKHIRINGLLPFNCIDPEPEGGYDTDKECLRDWFARMNTATFGVRIGWTGPVESRPNKTMRTLRELQACPDDQAYLCNDTDTIAKYGLPGPFRCGQPSWKAAAC